MWRSVLAGVVFLACGGAFPEALPAARAADRPNFVFILIDDLAHDTLGFTGRIPGLKTPHIDRLAAEGARFDNAFVTISLCSPSRGCFLTGMHAHRHGVFTNQGQDLSPETPTFPQALQRGGYATAYVGKWHMGRESNPRPGFDYWLSFAGQGQYFDPPLNENGREFKAEGYMTDLLTDYAVKWLTERRPRAAAGAADKPFCLYLGHKAVHGPFTPAPRHKGALDDLQLPEPPSWKEDLSTKPQWMQIERAAERGEWNPRVPARIGYLEAIMAVDDSVGRVMDAVKQIGAERDTVFIFTSDNGFFLGEHGRGDKRLAYEESLRIPLIVRYPAAIEPGAKIDEMALSIDVCPTILELAGVEPFEGIQGRSLAPLLKGERVSEWRRSFLYEYFQEGRFGPPTDIVAVRTPEWKYVAYPDLPGQAELYDLRNDPHELKNLVNDRQWVDTLTKMKAELERLKEATGYRSPPPPKAPAAPAAKKKGR